jgi:PPP family 3-phenylpropionic acid transporter
MNATLSSLQHRIAPGLRGAIFYAAYWGAIGLIEPFLNVYFLSLGVDAARIGWLSAILPLCTLTIAPVVTRLADRARRRVLFLALFCLGLGGALLIAAVPGFNPAFLGLIGFVTLYAAMRGPIIALADSLTASMADRHALDFGAMRLWGSLVFTFTASLLGGLWVSAGYNIMFLSAGLALLPVALIALLLEEPGHSMLPEAAEPTSEKPAGKLTMELGVVFLLCATFLVIGVEQMAGTFGTLYMKAIGGSGAMVGAVMGISALGEVPGMLYGSRVARRLGDTTALLLGYLLIGAGMAGYALFPVPGLMLAFSLLRGLGYGQLLVSTVTILNKRAPQGYTSTYQGILNASCWGLAPLLAGPIGGWIYQGFNPTTLFWVTVAMMAAAMVTLTPTYRLWKKDGSR